MAGSVFSAYPKCTVPLFGSEFSRLYCQFRQTPDEYSESCKSRNKKVEADTFVIAYHDRCGVRGCVCMCVCLCEEDGATESLNEMGPLQMHDYFFFYHTTFVPSKNKSIPSTHPFSN